MMNGMPDVALVDLVAVNQWVAWRAEERDGKTTKIPYCSSTRKAEADNPETWLPHDHAVLVSEAIGGGIGIELGPCGSSRWIIGIDLDTCRDPATG
jgi:putative DNA primase/helicase